MNDQGEVFCFQPTIDLCKAGPLFPSLYHATFGAVMTEINCFLTTVGLDTGARLHKSQEMWSDIESAVLRLDEPGVLLTFDGRDLRLFISTDDEKLANIEIQTARDNHSSFGIMPHIVRAWIEEGGRYAKSH